MTIATSQATDRTTVGILFGGRSSEHAISVITAAGVMQALDRGTYEPVLIGITRDGVWHLSDERELTATREADTLPEFTGQGPEVHLPLGGPTAHRDHLVLREADGSFREGPRLDVVFPLLHGPFGEDGTLQGLLEMAGLPYVGSGVTASAVGMDKHFMKMAFEAAGLQVGPYRVITARQWERSRQESIERVRELGLPVFVKPARAGSSCGITRVEDWAHLEAAVAEAQEFDPKVVVEAGIEGREIECAVLDGHHHDAPRASHPGEVVVVGKEDAWYDFETKYVQTEDSVLRCPADLPQPVRDDIRAQAVRAFLAVDAEGLARADFFWTTDERVVINEINTLPGFTPISMYRLMWEETGIGYAQLVDELLRLALERPVGLR